ncbi:hypothetical protein [Asinibacterium sp. OR53]|uniref:hypothetical protein n=1 Tax=Asinibacterium sp. OR53 TaxID=925409 RepID=UPI00047D32CB|nr:hypothetical protein [Asinibacterium sp. OR53]
MKVFAPYLPKTEGHLTIWVSTYKEKMGLLGTGLGLTAAEVAEQQAAAQVIIDHINKVDLKKVELKEAASAKELAKQNSLQLIRTVITRIKTLPAYTLNAGKELGIVASNRLVDENSLKPTLVGTAYDGYVSLSFNKQGMPGISLYSRLKGELEWQELDVAKSSPYLDYTPLAQTGKPETREYMAYYYDGFQETGFASDIVSVVYGG